MWSPSTGHRSRACARRIYGELERPSRYLDETDIRAGNLDDEGRWQEVPDQDIDVGMHKAGGTGRGDTHEGKGTGGRNEAKAARTLTPRARPQGVGAGTTTC